MKYIDRLLQGAPVEWLPLGEVVEYEQPTKYLVKSTNYKDSFSTPVLTAGKSFILGYTDEIDGIYKASESPVIIFDDFTTANKWVDFDFKAKSSAMKMITSKDPSKFSLRYIYHWLNTLPSGLVESDHKRQWISNYSKKKIPIPPVAVQEEVVRVLDKFTALEAALEAALDCRKRQYGYYRDALLTFDLSPSDGLCHSPLFPAPFAVEWCPLGEVAEYIRGVTYNKSAETLDSNGWLVLRANNIQNSTRTLLLEDVKRVDKSVSIRTNQHLYKGDILICAASGSREHVGKTAYISDDLEYVFGGFMGVIRVKDLRCLSRYLFHFLGSPSFTTFLDRELKSSTINNLSSAIVQKLEIPIPPLSVQERIVEILDKFDTLVNSISEGLPREIELRRKQYEYYRDALLSFEPLTSNL